MISEEPKAGAIVQGTPRLGLYILPNNSDQGVLETLLCECGEVSYPLYMERAKSYVGQFSKEELRQNKVKWKPFDEEKAIVAAVASILKPGKTNTVSIADNAWVSTETEKQIVALKNLVSFLRELISTEILLY
jgi:hypothetical protein